jgi:hypothetical protein
LAIKLLQSFSFLLRAWADSQNGVLGAFNHTEDLFLADLKHIYIDRFGLLTVDENWRTLLRADHQLFRTILVQFVILLGPINRTALINLFDSLK